MVEPMRVLFIGGLGRSGSTFLERPISELPGVCGRGEVAPLWERGSSNNEPRGCRRPFRDRESAHGKVPGPTDAAKPADALPGRPRCE